MKVRKQFILPALFSMVAGFVIMFILEEMQPGLSALANQTGALFTLADQTAGCDAGRIGWNIIYTFTDFAQGPFLCDTIIAMCMFIGAILNLYLTKIKSPHKGYFAGEIWIPLVCTQTASMLMANLFWRYIVGWEGWFPSFAGLVSTAPMAVLNFGKPTFKKCATGAVLGAIIPVWAIQMLLTYFSTPLGLPAFAAIGLGLSGSSVIGTNIYKLLPWMKEEPADTEAEEAKDEGVVALQPKNTGGYLVWLRTWGGDISELFYWSSNLAGLGVILGAIVSFVMNPSANGCGLLTPKFIFLFIFASALGMIIWAPKYLKDGIAFTFEALLPVGALLGAFPTLTVMIPVAIVSAFVAPAILHWSTTNFFYKHYALSVAVQSLGSVMTIVGFYALKAIGC